MNDRDILSTLARAYGLAEEYDDIWGQRHQVAAETLRTVLEAMGVAVGTKAELERSLGALHAQYWGRLCDPVLVLRGHQPGAMWEIRIPSAEGQDAAWTVAWILTAEGGAVQDQGAAGPGGPVVDHSTVDGVRHMARRIPVPAGLPLGYYRLTICVTCGSRQIRGESLLVMAPTTCYVPPGLMDGPGTWGLWVQLYALRGQRNWGIGDFSDLASLVQWVGGELGGGAVGVNPLHALKNTRPYHISPYSPHSRSFLNEIYLDPERVPEFLHCEAAQRLVKTDAFLSRLEGFRKSEWVDYEGIHAAKLEVLELLYRQFVADSGGEGQAGHGTTRGEERGHAFAQYCQEQGDALEGFALFLALTEHFNQQIPAAATWREWPIEYRHPGSPAVAAFRVHHQDRIRFHQYVQWQTHEQLALVTRRTKDLRMRIGLYHDLALGSDPNSAEGWLLQDVLVLGVTCGCPPDAFALQGQNWGFPPFHPVALREQAYRPFIELLRQNLSRGGALRLDHVMWLFRLFWIPKGQSPAAGVYVQYPFEDLLGILALESHRAETVVIGEDLGTVPDWIREQLARVCAFSYRVWYFERNGDGSWKVPGQYPAHSLAVATTHDLPTLAGFWQHDDLQVRERLGLLADPATRHRVWKEREVDKRRMLEVLRDYGGWAGADRTGDRVTGWTAEIMDAVHRFLARTGSRIVLASLEDWIGGRAQANLPGTFDEYPNWSRKTSVPLEEIRRDPQCLRLARLMNQERGGTGQAASGPGAGTDRGDRP